MDTSFYSDLATVGLAVHLTMKANHKDKKMLWNSKEIIVKRGQMITGRKALAKETKTHESRIYRKLEILKNVGFLDIESNNRFSLITIKNYDIYQNDIAISNSRTNNKRTTSEQQANTNNNDNNDKNVKKETLTNNIRLLIDIYCKGYENHFKIKPFYNEMKKTINMPAKEVMALNRMLKRYGFEKVSKWFEIDSEGDIPLFVDERVINDSWAKKNCYYPCILENIIERIKFEQQTGEQK